MKVEKYFLGMLVILSSKKWTIYADLKNSMLLSLHDAPKKVKTKKLRIMRLGQICAFRNNFLI
jgi:hypothetical protein